VIDLKLVLVNPGAGYSIPTLRMPPADTFKVPWLVVATSLWAKATSPAEAAGTSADRAAIQDVKNPCLARES